MEATYSSETFVNFQRTTRRYIPEDRTLYNHRYENLKSYIFYFIVSIFLVSVELHCASTTLLAISLVSFQLLTGTLRLGSSPQSTIWDTVSGSKHSSWSVPINLAFHFHSWVKRLVRGTPTSKDGDTSLGIQTRIRTGRPEFDSWQGHEIFSILHSFQTGWAHSLAGFIPEG
jgi:hypothetical protein